MRHSLMARGPDPDWGNVTQVESTARSEAHMVNTGFNINLPWHRTFLFVNYTLAQAKNDTDGGFSLPVNSFDASAEWGPTQTDVRHRVSSMFNMNLWKGFKIAGNLNGNSAPPYNITTGHDDNDDTVSNDRPSGVGRNVGTTASRWDLGARLSYSFGFGSGPATACRRTAGDHDSRGRRRAAGGAARGGAENKRCASSSSSSATNILNHTSTRWAIAA